MKKFIWFIGLAVFLLLLTGCSDSKSSKGKEEPILLKISAAVSLTDALEEIQSSFEKEHKVELSFNLAGSGTLAQQIQQGAPVDVFISANEQWMDKLEEEELIVPNSRSNVTGNNLVLIAHKDSSLSYQSFEEISLDDVAEIAVGNPESVPAGRYTQDALSTLNMWDEIQDHVILAKDVRQVLTYVETGNADIGFVYESDALSSTNIKILASTETGQHDPIIYPGAVVADTKHEDLAKVFLDYLLSDEAQEVLVNHGFKK